MLKKVLFSILFLSSYMFAVINLQTASKEELMSISGIGVKRAEAIIKYRKSHKIKSADDLLKIKGIGKSIVDNVKKGVKNKKRGLRKARKKSSKKLVSKKNQKKSKKQTSYIKKKSSKSKKTKEKRNKREKKVSKKVKNKNS